MFNTTDFPLANTSLSLEEADDVQGGGGGGGGGDDDFVILIVLIIILSVFSVVGCIGNALAFLIYYRKREKGTSTIFILCLALTDFFASLIAIPFSMASIIVNYKHVYDIVCKMYNFVITSNILLSSLIMVAIGFDRYFCICHPFLHAITVRRAKIIIAVLTVVSMILGIVPSLGYGVYVKTTVSVNDTITVEQDASFPSYALSPLSESSSSSPSSALDSMPQASPANKKDNENFFTNGMFVKPSLEFQEGMGARHKTGFSQPAGTALPTTSSNQPSTVKTFVNFQPRQPDVTPETMVVQRNKTEYIKGVQCHINSITVSRSVVFSYQRFYASIFLIEFCIIAFLYALIYRSILVRRAWNAKRKRTMSCAASSAQYQESTLEETQLTTLNGAGTETILINKKNQARISAAMRDRTLYANIRTAAMLFVVTVFYVLSYLPSWLMSLNIIPFNIIVFFLFYANNSINPFIYAFMNRAFREDLMQLLKGMCRR